MKKMGRIIKAGFRGLKRKVGETLVVSLFGMKKESART
jgi:hypothetical protein